MNPRWSPAETEKLRRLYATNLTAQQIADEIGRPLRAVYVKAHKLGLPAKEDPNRIRLDAEQREWLRKAYPHVRTEICATRLGISHRSVVRLARKMKLEKTPEFMRDTQAYTAQKAKESHLRNGTYPKKGVVNDNIAKGAPFRFKPGHVSPRKKTRTDGDAETKTA